jgi:hypothetical protein
MDARVKVYDDTKTATGVEGRVGYLDLKKIEDIRQRMWNEIIEYRVRDCHSNFDLSKFLRFSIVSLVAILLPF